MVITPFLEACAPFTPLPKYSPRVCTCTFLTREEYIAAEKAEASHFGFRWWIGGLRGVGRKFIPPPSNVILSSLYHSQKSSPSSNSCLCNDPISDRLRTICYTGQPAKTRKSALRWAREMVRPLWRSQSGRTMLLSSLKTSILAFRRIGV